MGTPYTTSVSAMALYLMAFSAVCAYPAAFTTGNKAGDACRPRTIFCADGDGMSPRYLKCIQGQLVEEVCPRDSICIGSKDTTVFCAVDMAADPTGATVSSSSLAVSSTTTMVIHASFGSQHTWPSSDIHSILSTTHSTSSVARADIGPVAMYSSHTTSAKHNSFTNMSPNSSQSKKVQFITGHASEQSQSRPPLHHHFSDSLQEHRQHQQPLTSPAPTPTDVRRSSVLVAPIGPHRTLPLPPALSYNKQKLPVVTTKILSKSASVLTTPHITAVSSAVLPVHVQSRAREDPKKLNNQIHTPLLITEQAESEPADKIGDLSAEKVMSVIGNVLISQRVDSALGDDSEVESVAPTEADQDQVLPVQSEPTETSLDTAVTGDSSDMDNINSDSNLENNNQNESLATSSKDQQAVSSYTPLSTPAVCTPGHFVCEAPGLRAGYFACDSGGFALPAVCGAKEVCYQIEKSILCDAPKV